MLNQHILYVYDHTPQKTFAQILIVIALYLSRRLIDMTGAIFDENAPFRSKGFYIYIYTSKSNTFLFCTAFVYFPILERISSIVLVEFVRHLDKQITRMYLFQMTTNTIASVQFATTNVYRSLIIDESRAQDRENMIIVLRIMIL
ncbi:unnamed protein product [Rotaria sp. Silwood1]|nr:unnamed protein product [Rotaria sp. Silwood1]CAF1599883.1 unnamed protein product [Rotaria sp. Silwood1]